MKNKADKSLALPLCSAAAIFGFREKVMKKFLTLFFIIILILAVSVCGHRVNAPALTEKPNPGDVMAEGILSRLTTEQKIGQLFCVSFSGTELGDEVKEFLKEYSIGNVILFSKNIDNAAQTARLCSDLQTEITANTGAAAFIGTDQEGGTVVRVTDGAVYYPGAMAIAASGSIDDARLVGENMGEELKALGINIDFAPDADINSNPDNPVIGVRSYGDSPKAVGELAAAFAEGMMSSDEICAAKHYPGHGDTATDSHYGLPMVDKSLNEIIQSELMPFKRLIETGVPAIMAAHIMYPQIDGENPASMSKILLTDILRNELGFDGMVVTDGLRMGAITDNFGMPEACVAAVNAGADLLLTGSGGESEDASFDAQIECVEKVRSAVQSGEITNEKLDSAVLRILKCKSDYGADKCAFSPLSDETLNTHRALAKEISKKSITLVRDRNTLLPIKEGERVLAVSSDSIKRLDESDIKADVSPAEYIAEKTNGDAESIPDDESGYAELAYKATGYDKVVICVSRPSHIELANAVLAKNANTVVVSLGSPYALRQMPDCSAFLCAYEYTSDAVESVAELLVGEAQAQGRLPVVLD